MVHDEGRSEEALAAVCHIGPRWQPAPALVCSLDFKWMHVGFVGVFVPSSNVMKHDGYNQKVEITHLYDSGQTRGVKVEVMESIGKAIL